MLPFFSVPISCFLVITALMAAGVDSEHQLSIYEVLRAHGLPMGLMPKGVKDFYIDDGGKFEVHLDQDCNAKFESELHYEMNISGTLSYGLIGELKGITAQELFLWFPVKEIRVDIPSSGLIYFDVGVVFKQFSLSFFETPPDCMVGLADSGGIQDSQSKSGKFWNQYSSEDFGRNVAELV